MSSIADAAARPAAGAGHKRRPINYATPRTVTEKRPDGSILWRSATPLEAYEPSLARLFRTSVERAPDRTFLAERDTSGAWRRVSYADARRQADAIAQSLIDRGLSPERPVAILSGNSVDHGLLTLGAYTAGIPVAPVSVAYSLQAQDFSKVRHIVDLLSPGLIYVADTGPFAKALGAINLAGVKIVANRNSANLTGVTAFDELTRITPGPAVEAAVGATHAGTIAKFLFTSGSTSLPKGVINTHGMLTANQQQIHQTWSFLTEQPLVLVDWLPWNHTFGGNYCFNLVMRQTGTFYIDGGKPAPALIGESVRNLGEISPTVYLNVPAGFGALLPHLERDENFARSFFARLQLILYAGAALPPDLWDRLEAVSLRTLGGIVPMTSAWGSTETAPLATAAHFLIEKAGPIGVPVSGLDLKLAPAGDKLEARVRGPNITPGYWKRPDLTAAAFDEEGFYKMGDAVRFADPADPNKGIVFDGRLAEDFKLTTGVWVQVGSLRVGLLGAAAPVLQDAVIAGENRDALGVLAWVNAAGCQSIIGEGAPPDLASLSKHPKVREHVRQALARWNTTQKGSSQRITRVILLPDAPSIDGNEITDKGYVNQRATLDRRKTEVERLFAATPDSELIVLDQPPR